MKLEPQYRGIIRLESAEYGRSVLGAPLLCYPSRERCRLLVFAGIHGEEPETTFLLSRAVRAFEKNFEHISVVLCANPDGVALGTRGNANGVDLNRNFATSNWDASPVPSRSVIEGERDTLLSPGKVPGSEPETSALVSLVERLRPETVISVHSPIGCIDAPEYSAVVRRLQGAIDLPWKPDIGYPTPGSFGTWCKERSLECITLELPRLAPELLFERYGESFARFLAAED